MAHDPPGGTDGALLAAVILGTAAGLAWLAARSLTVPVDRNRSRLAR